MRKSYIWIASIVLLGLLAFGAWSITNRAYSAENTLEAVYQRGFYDLIEKVDNINILLSKSAVTSSDSQKVMTLTTVWHQAEAARESLSTLPLGEHDMTNTQKYFAQLGDFCYSCANKLVNKEEVTQDDWEKLKNFKSNTQKLNHHLRRLQSKAASGRLKWEQSSRLGLRKPTKSLGVADNFAKIDQKLKKEVPTITYDGPFSDHVENIVPINLKGKNINGQEAIKIARDFLKNITEGEYDLNIVGKVKGTVPAYTIEFMKKGKDEPEYIADISEKGGHVLWFLSTRKLGKEKVGIEKAIKNAKDFLVNIGYRDMEPTGSLREKGSVVITFVPKQGEVFLYPDFMKVEVALDNGEIVAFDSTSYLTFHKSRKMPKNILTKEEILKKINKKLTINRVRKTIIPKQDKSEKLCYEVDVNLDDERYFIYIDAVRGKEEHILKVVETDKGTMTM